MKNNIILQYLQTRFSWHRYLPLVILLLFAAIDFNQIPRLEQLMPSGILLFGLLLQFRLWDDFHDLPYDRIHHANRVLVHDKSKLLGKTLLSIFLINIILLIHLHTPLSYSIFILL
ncbi:MAG: YwqG family protein, partial [Gammaproteobacteria bacterium]|nr:YwqG family protein [Gammaproteobacteria bacterium]